MYLSEFKNPLVVVQYPCWTPIPDKITSPVTSYEVLYCCKDVINTNLCSRDSWLQVGSVVCFFSKNTARKEFNEKFKNDPKYQLNSSETEKLYELASGEGTLSYGNNLMYYLKRKYKSQLKDINNIDVIKFIVEHLCNVS